MRYSTFRRNERNMKKEGGQNRIKSSMENKR